VRTILSAGPTPNEPGPSLVAIFGEVSAAVAAYEHALTMWLNNLSLRVANAGWRDESED